MTSTFGLADPATADRGFIDFLDPPSPAAGANFSFTMDRGDWCRVISCTATLATDANSANRTFALDYILARSITAIRNAPTAVYTAGTTATVFQWDHAHTVSEWNANTIVFVPLVDILLAPGNIVQLTVDNKQVGDQISAIHFVLERFYPLAGTPAPPETA